MRSNLNISSFYTLQKLFLLFFAFSSHFHGYCQIMEFEKTLYDFGKIGMNTKQEHELKFKNTGDDTLIILSEPKTASSADVALIKEGKMKYAPNEEGIIIYKFDTKSPKIFNNNITIQTNNAIASAQIVRVHWEVLSDSVELPNWKKRINDHPTLNTHLDSLIKDNCYMRPGSSLEMPVINCYDGPCDSIKNVSVEEMGSLFNSNELVEIFNNSENYLIRLISFEALSRTNCSSDSLTLLLESLIINSEPKYSYELIHHFLDLVSPSKAYPSEIKKYSKSTKVDLDDFIYLSYMVNCCPSSCFGFSVNDWNPFEVANTHDLDFGTIDLSNFHKEKFVLHKKIVVCNHTEELIIIAPYHDNYTTCDKKSYRLSGKGTIAIDFKSVVNLEKGNQSIKRPIKIVDYQTKEEKTIWIKAYFINCSK